MNNRLLEIIKNPEALVSNDIEILEKEILHHPYIQSYRTLQLLATHRFNEDLYPEKLSETAAYTTDKKILYHLIHQKETEKSTLLTQKNTLKLTEAKELKSEEEQANNSKVEKFSSTQAEKFQEVEIISIESPKPVYIDGEINRILFEGEENLMKEEPESVDLEASQESGTLVIASKDGLSGEFSDSENYDEVFETKNDLVDDLQKKETENPSEETTRKFTPETIINEEKIDSETAVLEQFSQLSFHGIDANLKPENILANDLHQEEHDNSKNFSTEETRKFTTETIINEEKIETEEDVVDDPSQLSFHGSNEFLPNFKIEVKKEGITNYKAENKASKHEIEMQKLIAEVNAKMKKSTSKNIEDDEEFLGNNGIDFTSILHDETPKTVEKIEKSEINKNQETEISTTWKPMNFGNEAIIAENIPIEKSSHYEDENIAKTEDLEEKKPEDLSLKQDENISVLPTEAASEQIDNQEISNIPTFINTWQNWLKLGSEQQPRKVDVKQKAIETFIEKEPKISKLKEESSFTVKDKGDNISHLMTETLANLYLDQKLYAKAQKAFELLIEKEPEKAEKFSKKLIEITELRKKIVR
ncbi:hypothetical protein SAMN05421847_1323 [Halpernia humi]|uniref:Uncharacterized protein n=1 Tax=Halpernia humi TaxID=493375 RepID=A0A1H5WTD5_9FLAO|nr:hypothetical protein [Halpernia humi]SEG02530.1 hypothetical protein SAMN05421847_1323 [Halpernia humi]